MPVDLGSFFNSYIQNKKVNDDRRRNDKRYDDELARNSMLDERYDNALELAAENKTYDRGRQARQDDISAETARLLQQKSQVDIDVAKTKNKNEQTKSNILTLSKLYQNNDPSGWFSFYNKNVKNVVSSELPAEVYTQAVSDFLGNKPYTQATSKVAKALGNLIVNNSDIRARTLDPTEGVDIQPHPSGGFVLKMKSKQTGEWVPLTENQESDMTSPNYGKDTVKIYTREQLTGLIKTMSNADAEFISQKQQMTLIQSRLNATGSGLGIESKDGKWTTTQNDEGGNIVTNEATGQVILYDSEGNVISDTTPNQDTEKATQAKNINNMSDAEIGAVTPEQFKSMSKEQIDNFKRRVTNIQELSKEDSNIPVPVDLPVNVYEEIEQIASKTPSKSHTPSEQKKQLKKDDYAILVKIQRNFTWEQFLASKEDSLPFALTDKDKKRLGLFSGKYGKEYQDSIKAKFFELTGRELKRKLLTNPNKINTRRGFRLGNKDKNPKNPTE